MSSRAARTSRPNTVLNAALAHSDLAITLGPGDVPSAVDLTEAARLLLLLSQEGSPLYRRAATSWLSRYAIETRDLTPAMLADAATALDELEQGDLEAVERLRSAARRSARLA